MVRIAERSLALENGAMGAKTRLIIPADDLALLIRLHVVLAFSTVKDDYGSG